MLTPAVGTPYTTVLVAVEPNVAFKRDAERNHPVLASLAMAVPPPVVRGHLPYGAPTSLERDLQRLRVAVSTDTSASYCAPGQPILVSCDFPR